MYTFTEIEDMLSTNIKQVCSDPDTYDIFKNQASYLFRDFAGVDIAAETPPDWTKQPFAWLIEYLASNRLSAITDEYRRKIEKQYGQAFRIMDKHSREGQSPNNFTPGTGNMGEVYGADF